MADNRPFHYAVLASLGLHALVLFAFPDWWEPARRALQEFPPALIARLTEPEPAPPQAQPAPPIEKPAPPVEKPAPPKPKAAKPAPQRVPEPEAVIAPTPAPAAPAPPPQVSPPRPTFVPAPASPPVAAVQPAPPSAAPSASELAAQSADQYRMELIAAMSRVKDRMRYPRQAEDNKWYGDVRLGISISANGKASFAVNRSSEYEILDRHAVEVARQAFRETAIPPALRGKDWVLADVTVRFEPRKY